MAEENDYQKVLRLVDAAIESDDARDPLRDAPRVATTVLDQIVQDKQFVEWLAYLQVMGYARMRLEDKGTKRQG